MRAGSSPAGGIASGGGSPSSDRPQGSAPVAVDAPDDALPDLTLQHLDAAPGRQRRDLGFLAVHVVELEHHGIALSAVHAAGAAEPLEKQPVIPSLASGPSRPRDPCDPIPAAAHRGSAPMAAGADHLTARQFAIDALQARALGDEFTEIALLRPAAMVPLEDERVAQAAVGAGRALQQPRHMLSRTQYALATGNANLVPMQLPACGEVRPEAVAAPVLPALTGAVERRQRQHLLTPGAAADLPLPGGWR